MLNASNTSMRDILQHLLFKKRMTATDLSRQTGVPQPTIHRIISGKCVLPHLSTLQPIAHYFDLTVEQLKGEQNLPESLLTQLFPVAQKSTLEVPIFAWEDLSSIDTANKISVDGIFTSSPLSKNSFAVSMPDKSMEPIFSEETMLIFDRNKEAVNRSYVLVQDESDNTVIFRQLITNGDMAFLKAMNTDGKKYPLKVLDSNCTVIAALVESRHIYFEGEEL